jgi:hypothetical protein
MREEAARPEPGPRVWGCPVRLKVENGRWIAEIQDPDACAPTIDDMNKLGPEAKRNLARHLTTDDPQQDSELKQMRRRTQ